jgi:hypothetical protein
MLPAKPESVAGKGVRTVADRRPHRAARAVLPFHPVNFVF